ncbi:16S rRNA (adenine(1518)-N(6)/adenine(1519)-N(6))-dimethyltransferase RsmA [Asticcacaulis sp. ZE23SCel15]|uniref:16S rRNA (adenine(1518)-N(6)/adenine(1519)-N(6))- dimethyltransferase RsmA n=1 Tax=Asticcacaulis sp. ZE23SCel15 TaxID=3059027 RepID=UPI00265F2194|nr:16S rRNA (adenine(1518)-N(6)/adenine(1519)-N(6))-dimethyltransferase RsmA [Asticcacaulis sp. ZE23SCel15]WKL56374.1 16S rRNA (adenine(1518)-N(6)/adenine(1519)-N(6))-dimethyltransferase RsmA [Asticcacaulis sp. ZE23SCel15]
MTPKTQNELPSLRDSLEQHGLMAKKSFGQHFLLDLNITRKIVRLGGPFDGDVVIEVGPGPGGLTRALLESDARSVLAIEKDARFIELLSELNDTYGTRFDVIEADAVKADERALLAERDLGEAAHMVSNLPYNVGTPLLIKWLTGPWQPLSMTLMFQLEVALRVVAPVDDNDYGRLSVIAQVLCDCEKLMDLPARAFTPPPKVDSAVVKLTPKTDRPDAQLIRNLEKVTAAAFGQRRKMLRASLKPLGGEALLEKAGIDPTARAETVSPDRFLKLASLL